MHKLSMDWIGADEATANCNHSSLSEVSGEDFGFYEGSEA